MYYEYTSSATLQTFMILVLYKSRILFAVCQEFELIITSCGLCESTFNYNCIQLCTNNHGKQS